MYVEMLEDAGYIVTVKHTFDGNEMFLVASEAGTTSLPMSRLAGGGKMLNFYEAVEVQAKKYAAEVGLHSTEKIAPIESL